MNTGGITNGLSQRVIANDRPSLLESGDPPEQAAGVLRARPDVTRGDRSGEGTGLLSTANNQYNETGQQRPPGRNGALVDVVG